jgi:putative transposase
MTIDIKNELKNIILNTTILKNTYNKTHTNTKYTLDLIITEICYFLKSGVSWRNLRSKINYKTLYWHYTNFVKYNVFIKLFNQIKLVYLKKYKYRDATLLIDSTCINNKYGINKIGRNKFYKNKKVTKISLMTDINGFPLSILFMKGNYHDNNAFDKHVRDALIIMPKNKKTIMADKAYSSHKNYELLDFNNIKHIIPPRSNMKLAKTYKYSKKEYIKRIKIEHIFGRLKTFRRFNVRYEKLLRNFSGFIHLSLSYIAVNILKSL